MRWYEFDIQATPLPKGSTKSFPHPKTGKIVTTSTTKGLKPYQRHLGAAAAEAMLGQAPMIGPVRVNMAFIFARPKSHRRARGDLKPDAPQYPTTRADVDKLVRAVLDGLEGVAYLDDKQVVVQYAEKFWGPEDRVRVQFGGP